MLTSSGVPARVLFELEHEFVERSGSGFAFSFADAPMPEVAEALGRVYHVAVAYSGRPTRELSGRFQGDSAFEVLLQIVDRTNLRFSLDGTTWGIEEIGTFALPVANLSDFLKRPAAAKDPLQSSTAFGDGATGTPRPQLRSPTGQ